MSAGGWQSTHSIPEDRGLLGSFNQVSDNNKVCQQNQLASVEQDRAHYTANSTQDHQRDHFRLESSPYCRGG